MKLSKAGIQCVAVASVALVAAAGVGTTVQANVAANPSKQLNIKYSGSVVNVFQEVDYSTRR